MPELATSATRRSQSRSTRSVIVAGVLVLVVHSALIVAGISELGTLVVNLAFAGALVALAARSGLSRRELGLEIRRASIKHALLVGTAVVAVTAVVAATKLLPTDPAMARLGAADLWFRVLVAIPVGTAVCEEVMFRGVLLAAWGRSVGSWSAVAAVSALFGLWHVAAEAQRAGGLSAAIVPGVVATAAVSAFLLCPLRRRTGDLLAPIAVHAAANLSVFVFVLATSRTIA